VAVVAVTYAVSTALFVDALPAALVEDDQASLAAADSLEEGDVAGGSPYKQVGEAAGSRYVSQEEDARQREAANTQLVALAKERKSKAQAKRNAHLAKLAARVPKVVMETDQEAEKTAEIITATSKKVDKALETKIGKQVQAKLRSINEKRKAAAAAVALKKDRKKAMAQNELPANQEPSEVSSPVSHKQSPPPTDGLSEHAKSPIAAVRAQDHAEKQVRKELHKAPKKKFSYNLKKAEAKAEKQQKAAPKPAAKQGGKKADPNLSKAAHRVAKGVGCFTADNECNPEACLCKKGQAPVPLPKAQPKLSKAAHPAKGVGCFTADNECNPEACLCRKGHPPTPLPKAVHAKVTKDISPQTAHAKVSKGVNPKTAHAKVTKGVGCFTADNECNPEACLCKKGQAPVPKHEVMLGESGLPTAAPTYEALPPDPDAPGSAGQMKAVPAQGEHFAEKAAKEYVTFSHPDKFQKSILAGAQKAISKEKEMGAELTAAAKEQHSLHKWDKAAKAEMKAGHVKAERADADHAWHAAMEVTKAEQKVPVLASSMTAQGDNLAKTFPTINAKTGKVVEGEKFNAKANVPNVPIGGQTDVERTSMNAAFAAIAHKEAKAHQAAKVKAAQKAQADAEVAAVNKLTKNPQVAAAALKIMATKPAPTAFIEVAESKSDTKQFANAEELGESKAHAEDALKAMAAKQKRATQARISRWTMKHTANLGKLMVTTQAVDKALVAKRAKVTSVQKQLGQLRTMLQRVVKGDKKLQDDDSSIVESTEELSREELGDVQGHDDQDSEEMDLGESSDANESDEDDLGASLAEMSASFAKIQSSMQTASQQEAQIEAAAALKAKTKEANLKHKAGLEMKKQKAQALETLGEAKSSAKAKPAQKIGARLQKKLDKEEAQIRMTTVKKVKAMHKLEKDTNAKRAKNLSKAAPITKLTPEMQTRMEYQRMYLQTEMQKAEQAKADLENKVENVKNNDAEHLRRLTDSVAQKRHVLKRDMQMVQNLKDEYERDHELGEGVQSTSGAAALAQDEAQQEKSDIQDDKKVIAQSDKVIRALKDTLGDNHASLLKTAKGYLGISKAPGPISALMGGTLGESAEIKATDTEGLNGSPLNTAQIKLGSQIAVSKAALKLKIHELEALGTKETSLMGQAQRFHDAAMNARAHEYEAQSRTAAMSKEVGSLNNNVARHERSMELGEALFSKEKEEGEEEEQQDLGESSSTQGSVTALQDEIDHERDQMAAAEAEIKRIAVKGPKIVRDQIALDKVKYGAVLKKANNAYNKLHSRFVHTAAMLSPKLKSQQALDEAVADEKSRETDFANKLNHVAEYAQEVDRKAKAAESAARQSESA
jgi:hypothetical protein